jgi:hypothetical protein
MTLKNLFAVLVTGAIALMLVPRSIGAPAQIKPPHASHLPPPPPKPGPPHR